MRFAENEFINFGYTADLLVDRRITNPDCAPTSRTRRIRFAEQNDVLLVAAMATIALASPAHAVERDQVLGLWGNADGSYDCKAEPGTETAPVKVETEGGGFFVSAYAWGCTVKAPQHRGDLIGGDATCASEGDGEITPGRIDLGLTATGQLLLTRDGTVETLNTCVARK